MLFKNKFSKCRSYLITHDDVAKAIINQLIIEGTADNNIVFFLPIMFTINVQLIQPAIEPSISKDATQDASSEVKRTGYVSSFPSISIGKDGDAQPKYWPTVSIPRLPGKIVTFRWDCVCVCVCV